MKKLLFFILLSFWVIASSAQEILKVMPTQPSITDSIGFEIKTFIPLGSSFPADCPPFVGYTDSIKQNNFLIFDLYFDLSGGWLNYGCVRYDTVDVSSQLPVGNYTMIAYWHAIMDTSFGAGQYDTTDRSGSIPDTFYFSVSSTTSMQEHSKHKIRLYPNPVKEELNVSFNSQAGELEISVLDVNGKEHKIPLQNQDSHKWRLNTANLPPGVYILQLSSGEEVYNEKFVKF